MSIILSSTSSLNSSQTSILLHIKSKNYMIIDDLYVMFARKSFRKNVNIIQTKIISRQTRIISYFKSINSSKIKSLKFKIFTINFNFSSTSIKLVSINQTAETSHYYMFALKHLFLHRFFYICRFCREIFTFNNDLHRHYIRQRVRICPRHDERFRNFEHQNFVFTNIHSHENFRQLKISINNVYII